jgi:hypothetical protein
MKGDIEVGHWKKNLSLDDQKTIIATYTEQGKTLARIWPVSRWEKKVLGKQRFFMIFHKDCQVGEGDRLEQGTRKFRALSVKAFPKHCEAIVEEDVG